MDNSQMRYEEVLSALADKRGLDIVFMDLSKTSTIADNFILVTANSDIHMKTLRDVATKALDDMSVQYLVEGENSTQWCLIDGGNMVIHIFSKHGRDFYRLENIWGDVPMEKYEYED